MQLFTYDNLFFKCLVSDILFTRGLVDCIKNANFVPNKFFLRKQLIESELRWIFY